MCLSRKVLFKDVQRIVVKLGTRVLTTSDHTLDVDLIQQVADQVAALRTRGIQTAVVSSGAIGAGMGRLELRSRPRSLPQLQAAAAIGQNQLMYGYEQAFGKHGLPIGQVLLTTDDVLNNRVRYLNVRSTFTALFEYGAVPIVNENDSVATDEIRLGDNDTLSAHVTNLVGADLLIILTDLDGLYSADPRRNTGSTLVPLVEHITPEIEALAGSPGSEVAVGGMRTKIEAAKIVTGSGEMMIIANGKKDSLIDLLDGKDLGTLFLAQTDKRASRKRWIAFNMDRKGTVEIDAGAAKALVEGGSSLLASGIVAAYGTFELGDMIGILDPSGREIARGLTNYSTEELSRIYGRKSSEFEKILGYRSYDEVVHRDSLAVM